MKAREKILLSSFDLFRKKGFLQTGIAEILENANSYKKTLYDHFKSKDELGFEYLLYITERQKEIMRKVSEKSSSMEDFVDKWINLSLREQRNYGRFDCPIALFSGEVSHLDQFQTHSKAAIESVLETIESLVKENRSDLKKIEQKEISQELYILYFGGLKLFALTKDKKIIEQMKIKMKTCLRKKNFRRINEMSIEKNKEIVLEFFRFLNEQKMNEAFNLFHEDLNWWILGSLPISGNYDKRKISLGLKMLHRNFSNYIFTPSTITAEENRVSILLESHAIRKLNQKKYNNHFHFLFTLKDDKIIAVKEFFDTVHVVWVEEP